jgi:hypothetical protein
MVSDKVINKRLIFLRKLSRDFVIMLAPLGSSITENSLIRELKVITDASINAHKDREPTYRVVYGDNNEQIDGMTNYYILEDNPFRGASDVSGASKDESKDESSITDNDMKAMFDMLSSESSDSEEDDDSSSSEFIYMNTMPPLSANKKQDPPSLSKLYLAAFEKSSQTIGEDDVICCSQRIPFKKFYNVLRKRFEKEAKKGKTKKRKKRKKRRKIEKTPYSDLIRQFSPENSPENVAHNKYVYKGMIKKAYNNSEFDVADFRTRCTAKFLLNMLLREKQQKFSVSVKKKELLCKYLKMAIYVGLNYQELEKFEPLEPMCGIEHIKVSDLAADPYWEGIDVQPGNGEFISWEKLKKHTYDQYINPTKRKTLRKIKEVFGSYNVDFETATPQQLFKLCSLTTLEKAPFLHAAEDADISVAKQKWKNSERSYKPAVSVAYILSDVFPQLPEITIHNPADGVEVDLEFAKDLSEKMVSVGFLPEGCDKYCHVKQLDVPRGQKRRRDELFSPLEYSKC